MEDVSDCIKLMTIPRRGEAFPRLVLLQLGGLTMALVLLPDNVGAERTEDRLRSSQDHQMFVFIRSSPPAVY